MTTAKDHARRRKTVRNAERWLETDKPWSDSEGRELVEKLLAVLEEYLSDAVEMFDSYKAENERLRGN